MWNRIHDTHFGSGNMIHDKHFGSGNMIHAEGQQSSLYNIVNIKWERNENPPSDPNKMLHIRTQKGTSFSTQKYLFYLF